MKQTTIVMGMPVTIEIVDSYVTSSDIRKIFEYFISIDSIFSTYKKTSEISLINTGKLSIEKSSREVQEVLTLSEQTRRETHGYFNIYHNGLYDPSGLVKGWAIQNTTGILQKNGFKNFYIDVGGDIFVFGKNKEKQPWKIGIQNPFQKNKIIKVLQVQDKGIATSGTYIRGQHIYNPHQQNTHITEVSSITIVGPTIYDADRYATAAFAIGEKGIYFIESLAGFEGYMIDRNGISTYTSGFDQYVSK